MSYSDPQCRYTSVAHKQPPEFRAAQETFNLTETFESIAAHAIERYTHNLMALYETYKEMHHVPEAQQEVRSEAARAEGCDEAGCPVA